MKLLHSLREENRKRSREATETELFCLRYCLAKQLDSIYAISSDYGEFLLDDELKTVVAEALRPYLQERLRGFEEMVRINEEEQAYEEER